MWEKLRDWRVAFSGLSPANEFSLVQPRVILEAVSHVKKAVPLPTISRTARVS